MIINNESTNFNSQDGNDAKLRQDDLFHWCVQSFHHLN